MLDNESRRRGSMRLALLLRRWCVRLEGGAGGMVLDSGCILIDGCGVGVGEVGKSSDKDDMEDDGDEL